MGNNTSSVRKLNPKTIKDLQKHVDVDFSSYEIQEWYNDYKKHLGAGETTLSRTTFIQVYNSVFDGDASAFAGHVFRTFDRDKNNAVDFQEFILGLCMSGSHEPAVKLRWAFDMYDIDQNGYITMDEMIHILSVSLNTSFFYLKLKIQYMIETCWRGFETSSTGSRDMGLFNRLVS